MNKQKGGRGIKAPYETTHVRIPVALKPEVERIIEQFHTGEYSLVNGDENIKQNKLMNVTDAIAIAKGILTQKKSARISITKLLTAFYGEKIEL